MSAKSVRTKADNRRQRMDHKSKYASSKIMVRPEHMMEERDDTILSPPTRDEIVCKSCGFKARYKFFRCPQCNSQQN